MLLREACGVCSLWLNTSSVYYEHDMLRMMKCTSLGFLCAAHRNIHCSVAVIWTQTFGSHSTCENQMPWQSNALHAYIIGARTHYTMLHYTTPHTPIHTTHTCTTTHIHTTDTTLHYTTHMHTLHTHTLHYTTHTYTATHVCTLHIPLTIEVEPSKGWCSPLLVVDQTMAIISSLMAELFDTCV